jgi:hypothetical protein
MIFAHALRRCAQKFAEAMTRLLSEKSSIWRGVLLRLRRERQKSEGQN